MVNIKIGGDEIIRHARGGAWLEKKNDMAIAWEKSSAVSKLRRMKTPIGAEIVSSLWDLEKS